MTTPRRESFGVDLEAATTRVILGRDDDGNGGLEGVLNGSGTGHASTGETADTAVALELQVTRAAPWVRPTTTHAIPAGGSRVVGLYDLASNHAERLVGLAAAPSSAGVAWSVALECTHVPSF